MANLFWKRNDGTTRLLATPFKTEDEFERTVFQTSELLEDIFLLKRQIRGGGKPGVPDMIGVDSDGNVCIIEMKNVPVDASIIPQVLQYAIWAETNPDSIKSLWLEVDDRPEDVTISWDDFQVRVLVIAPTILRSTLQIVDKINYPVDLIEVSRWIEGDNELLLVNRLEQDPKTARPKPARGLQVYDEEFYKTHYNRQSATSFLQYARAVEKLAKDQGWSLELKFNKHYCAFKAGFFNAFGIKWIGSKTFALFFKVTQEEAREASPIAMTKYEIQWKEAVYYIEPGTTKVRDFLPLFELGYRKLTGD